MGTAVKGQKKIKDRIASGEIVEQKCWSFIKELNSCSKERLDSVAIHDGFRTYTYRQMFRYWERYAEAFSAIGITEKNHSRVALITTPLTESVFAFYGLNMTGASVSLIYHFDLYDEKNIKSMIEKEKITDLVVSELFAFPKLMQRLLDDKERLGLNHIIVLESPMGGEYAIPALEVVRRLNAAMFRELSGGLLMEDLLRDHEAFPISYGSAASSDSSVILHTTGTVSGIHKPVPFSDKAMNSFVTCAIEAMDVYEDFKAAPSHMVSCLTLNMSWVYAMVDMLHTSLGLGMELITLPIGGSNPRYAEAIEACGISILFTSKAILDSWNKTMPDIDLSGLKVIFMGGSYVSPEFKKTFNGYLRSCGSPARIINGYGMSELGGACIISPSDRDDDAIGFLLPHFKAKIFSEEENTYYDIEDGPRTGVLFLSSPTMSSGRLDDTVFFELDNIDGDEYFNSNDLVRVNEDGSLTCVGRSNQFFVNNEGVRFDAGLVEGAVSSQPGIAACGLAPEFHKTLHDNVPILYVETSGDKADELLVVRKALITVFIHDGRLADTNMPSQCVFTDSIPLNSGGKVDAKKLASGTVEGRRFHVKPVRLSGRITDILLIPAAEGEDATMGAGIPEELEHDPYNILSEIFAAIPDLNKGRFNKIFRIPGLREMVLELTDFDIHNIPGSMNKLAPKLIQLIIDQIPVPFMKGERTMSKKKNTMKGFMPIFPGMDSKPPVFPFPLIPPMPDPGLWGGKKCGKDDCKEQWDEFESNMDTFWDQMRDMQTSFMDATREQWNTFFEQFLDMQETFIASLPDDAPAIFGLPTMSPRAFMEKVREFQEMANEHAVEQADSFADFCKKGQKLSKEAVSEAVENAKAKAEKDAEEEKKDVAEDNKEAAETKKETGRAKKSTAKAAEEAAK